MGSADRFGEYSYPRHGIEVSKIEDNVESEISSLSSALLSSTV